MEVHAHTHTPRKKWTHYFWEFLMLFLAVFCGFLAENQREHYIEHQREKKYARQMLSDLRTDSTFFAGLMTFLDSSISRYKKFEEIVNSASPTNYDLIRTYLKLQYVYITLPTTTTYSEMKSSGSFRYFQNEELSGQIKRYYETTLDFLKSSENYSFDFFKTYLQPFTISHFNMAEMNATNDSLLTLNPVFLNRNRETEIQMKNIMKTYQAFVYSYRESTVAFSAKMVNQLIGMLKKEYHLK